MKASFLCGYLTSYFVRTSTPHTENLCAGPVRLMSTGSKIFHSRKPIYFVSVLYGSKLRTHEQVALWRSGSIHLKFYSGNRPFLCRRIVDLLDTYLLHATSVLQSLSCLGTGSGAQRLRAEHFGTINLSHLQQRESFVLSATLSNAVLLDSHVILIQRWVYWLKQLRNNDAFWVEKWLILSR
jgi:hypothetical protein